MSYLDEWEALSARIKGISDAGSLAAQFLQINSGDSFGMQKALGRHCVRILESIKSFNASFGTVLPVPAQLAIKEFVEGQPGRLIATESDGYARPAIVFLSAFESEVSHLLHDPQEAFRSRAETGFLHLQRLIMVDSDTRTKWQAAFKEGETACERLGSIHLLWHGVLAFKINAEGARTDLAFNEPVLTSRAEGLVLTEWKKASSAKDSSQMFEQARRQTELYKQGALAGLELRRYRFLIVVTERALSADDIPQDIETSTVIYRHLNIACSPSTPSIAARST